MRFDRPTLSISVLNIIQLTPFPFLWLFTETKTKKAMKFTSNDGGGYFNTFLGNSIILTDSHVTRTFC